MGTSQGSERGCSVHGAAKEMRAGVMERRTKEGGLICWRGRNEKRKKAGDVMRGWTSHQLVLVLAMRIKVIAVILLKRKMNLKMVQKQAF